MMHNLMKMSLVALQGILLTVLAGCSGSFGAAQKSTAEPEAPMATLLRDRETALASLRSEMASARIDTAKREAELLELRALVGQLRNEITESRQVILDQRQAADMQLAELKEITNERDQFKQTKSEPAVQQITANDTLLKLAREVEQLKKGLARSEATPLATLKPPVKKDLSTADQDVSMLAMMVRPNPQEPSVDVQSQVKVQRGDTLSSLARRYRTTVAAIVNVNALRNEHIEVGQTLAIPGSGTQRP